MVCQIPFRRQKKKLAADTCPELPHAEARQRRDEIRKQIANSIDQLRILLEKIRAETSIIRPER